MSPNNMRRASHAGHWYSAHRGTLERELYRYICDAEYSNRIPKALICPHAAYSYCGPTAAWSWKHLQPVGSHMVTIFLFGPSHHLYLNGCALPESRLTVYETPFGELKLNTEILSKLRSTSLFSVFNVHQDEKEHSLELQLPFLKYRMENCDVQIVPIYVGDMSSSDLKSYAEVITPYFNDPNSMFIISSDFCHWGKRFLYTYVPSNCKDVPLHKSIEQLDYEGMKYIENHDLPGFQKYLKETNNTICGRNPIILFLKLLEVSDERNYKTEVLHYSQSEAITDSFQSSVSYAALMTYIN